MALIGRLFVILFGFLAASLVAGMIVVGAVLFPEFSDLGDGLVDQSALNIVMGFGFIFVSGFALLPAMLVVAITEAFYVRGALTYAVGGGLVRSHPADQVGEVLALDQLHRVVMNAALAADGVDGHDVRVVQLGRGLGLILKSL